MKTTIFRIQDSQGRGPFKPGFSEKWLDVDRVYIPEAPIQELLKIKKQADPELQLAFACSSIEDLKKWVSKTEYERLKKHSYFAFTLEVDKVWNLDGQVIAGRKRAYRKGVRIINLYATTASTGQPTSKQML